MFRLQSRCRGRRHSFGAPANSIQPPFRGISPCDMTVDRYGHDEENESMEQRSKQPEGMNSRRSFLGKGLALGVGTVGAAMLNSSLALGGVSAASNDEIT